jgi:hypothetical protein
MHRQQLSARPNDAGQRRENNPMNGKTSGLFHAIASFTDETGKPISGSGWIAGISDRDALLDDCLGVAELDKEGLATFLLNVADIKSLDSPGERTPDLYFTLFHNGKEVFRSEVSMNVDFESLHSVSGDPVKITREFGPYRIRLSLPD